LEGCLAQLLFLIIISLCICQYTKQRTYFISWFPSFAGFTFIIHILSLFYSLPSQECTVP
jgi:hypothetical protein